MAATTTRVTVTLNQRSRLRSRACAAGRRLFAGAVGLAMAVLPDVPARAALHHWSTGGPASTGPVQAIAVDPTNPQVVYAGSGMSGLVAGTVFKSTDGGQSWNVKNVNLPSGFYRDFAIHPQAPATIYAAGGIVYKSTDGADSWTPKNTNPAPASALTVTLDPQNPSVVFAGTAGNKPNNLFRSTNDGDDWQAVGGDLPNGIVNAVEVDPHDSSIVYAGTQFGLFKSTNGGVNWSPMNTGFTPSPTPTINVLAIDPQDPSIIYAGTGGFGVWKSVNGAASWVTAQTGLNDFLIMDMVIDPQRRHVLYLVTATGGAYRSTDSGQSWTPLNIGLGAVALTAIGISETGTCVHAGTNNNQNSRVFDYALVADCSPLPPGVPPLVAAVLPSSRSVQVGHGAATAFVTIINPASTPATGVGIKLGSGIPASLNFQITDPATNQVTGIQDVPADIPAGGSQTYVIAVTPTAAVAATEVAFLYEGENTLGPAATLDGINTLLLSASFGAIPDVVTLAATLTGDGIMNVDAVNGGGAFAVSTINLGAGGLMTVTADTGNANLPVNLFVCSTDATGQCTSPLASSISVQINTNETPTFTVFAAASGVIPFDAAANRAFIRFKDAGNVTRGGSSVALRTF